MQASSSILHCKHQQNQAEGMLSSIIQQHNNIINIIHQRVSIFDTDGSFQSNVAMITEYLSIPERHKIERTCKYWYNEFQNCNYWRSINANFDSKNDKEYKVALWLLLYSRRASLQSIVITISEEYLVVRLLKRCYCQNLKMFHWYRSLYWLPPTYSISKDGFEMFFPNGFIATSPLIDEKTNNEGKTPVLSCLLSACNSLQNLRIKFYNIVEAKLLMNFRSLRSLTVFAYAVYPSHDDDEVYAFTNLLIEVLKSVKKLSVLHYFEFKTDITQTCCWLDVVRISSRSMTIKSNSLQVIVLKLNKAIYIYDIICPSLITLSADYNIYGNLFCSDDEDEELDINPCFFEAIGGKESFDTIYENKNRRTKIYGIAKDFNTKKFYINHIELPANCYLGW